jgi:hypothetical protein
MSQRTDLLAIKKRKTDAMLDILREYRENTARFLDGKWPLVDFLRDKAFADDAFSLLATEIISINQDLAATPREPGELDP